MSRDYKYLFVSIKPEFTEKILSKEKSIELRKVRPHVVSGDYVIIYASSPVMGVVGIARVKHIIEMKPSELWEKYSTRLGIDKQRFDDYYNGLSRAVGIELDSVRPLSSPISLTELRGVDPSFHPPQIYRYVTSEQICSVLSRYFQTLKDVNR